MKILCTQSDFTMQGWAKTFEDLECQFSFWNMKSKPAFDIFDEIEPDIFIGSVNEITRGIAKCLKERPDTISLFYSPNFYLVSPEDKDYMKELKNETEKPDYIFSFCHESRLGETIGGWKELGYKIISTVRGADDKTFAPQVRLPKWGADVAIVRNYEPNLGRYIFPLCHKTFKDTIPDKFSIRIFGDGWPVSQGVGQPENYNVPSVFSSSRICLDIIHNTIEVSDTAFNVFLAGGFCLSNNASQIIPEIPNFKNPQELQELVRFYLLNPIEIEKTKTIVKQKIMKEHTYSHRIDKLLNDIGLEKETIV